MVLVVLGVVVLSVATICSTWGPRITGAPTTAERLGSAVAVVAFVAAALLCCWSYLAAVATKPGGVPADWHPFDSPEEAEAERLELERNPLPPERRRSGLPRPRFCKKCRRWKPERAHHCSVSGCCVLRMDHYCVWVVNTVGLLNYKAFLLFLFYTSVAAVAGVALAGVALARTLRADPEAGGTITLLLATAVLDAAFGLAVLGFLGMHAGLVAKNMTTIEAYEKSPPPPGMPWPYSAGSRGANFRAVFAPAAPAPTTQQQKGAGGVRRWLSPRYNEEERRQLLAGALAKLPRGWREEILV